MIRLTFILGIVWLFAGCSEPLAKRIPIFVYHDDAPYWLSNNSDISHYWVNEFNQRQHEVELVLTHISRPELNSRVESGQSYIILWANVLWFKWRDENIKSSIPIFWDADTLVSNMDRAINFTDPKRLFGLKIGARNGHFYSDLNEYFKQKKIQRINAESSLENYQRLRQHELDAFLDSRSTILYMQKTLLSSQSLYVSTNPQDAYSRNVLVSRDYYWLLPIFDKVIVEMHNDQSWQAKMDSWGLQELINPFELELEELDKI